MVYANFTRNSRYNDGTTSFRTDHADHLALRRSLVCTKRLCIGVQRHSRGGVTQQFLHDLYVLAVGIQQGANVCICPFVKFRI